MEFFFLFRSVVSISSLLVFVMTENWSNLNVLTVYCFYQRAIMISGNQGVLHLMLSKNSVPIN
jgi:hypothetical protein